MKIIQKITLLFALTSLFSCLPSKSEFVIEGKVLEADSSTLYLEKREINKVTTLDSIKLNKDGTFHFRSKATKYPEFYVLRINNQVINFAVDSTETISIKATKNKFATNYSIKGKTNEDIKKIVLAQYQANNTFSKIQQQYTDKELAEKNYFSALSQLITQYKNAAKQVIGTNFKSPAAYFALFQKISEYTFFDPYNKDDVKLLGAVATAWDIYYKDSPRAKHLHDYTLIAMKVNKKKNTPSSDILSSADVVTANDYYNIELPDINGKKLDLSSFRGKYVLLDFTIYQSKESPIHNIELNKIYTHYQSKLEIYQVSLDADLHYWKNVATNLPWKTVRDKQSIQSELIFKYNINRLPMSFLIDSDGYIIKRFKSEYNISEELKEII